MKGGKYNEALWFMENIKSAKKIEYIQYKSITTNFSLVCPWPYSYFLKKIG
jgi:hypothetical protein